MATGLIAAVAEDVLTGAIDLRTFDCVQLHDGDPGAAGTANVADEADRVQLTGTPPWIATGGTLANAENAEWEAVAATEQYTHFSAWTDLAAGTCGFTGTVAASQITAGDNFRIAAGAATTSLNVAA